MKRNEPVSHIMTTNLVTLPLIGKPSEARRALSNGTFHHLPVVEGTKLVGIINLHDMNRVFGSLEATDARTMDTILDHSVSIDDLMTKDVVTVSSHDTIRKAAEILAEGRFYALPVVDNGALVGMITTTDLLRYLIEQY